MLTDDERAQIRAELDPAQQAERWRSLALRLLDEIEAAEAQRGDDSELAGEVELLRVRELNLRENLDDCIVRNNRIIDIVNETIPCDAYMYDDKVQQLADTYRTEKERADRLQRENETLRAARESLEPVGWMISMSEYQCNVKPRCWFGTDINRGEKRQVYLAPPQPLEESC